MCVYVSVYIHIYVHPRACVYVGNIWAALHTHTHTHTHTDRMHFYDSTNPNVAITDTLAGAFFFFFFFLRTYIPNEAITDNVVGTYDFFFFNNTPCMRPTPTHCPLHFFFPACMRVCMHAYIKNLRTHPRIHISVQPDVV